MVWACGCAQVSTSDPTSATPLAAPTVVVAFLDSPGAANSVSPSTAPELIVPSDSLQPALPSPTAKPTAKPTVKPKAATTKRPSAGWIKMTVALDSSRHEWVGTVTPVDATFQGVWVQATEADAFACASAPYKCVFEDEIDGGTAMWDIGSLTIPVSFDIASGGSHGDFTVRSCVPNTCFVGHATY